MTRTSAGTTSGQPHTRGDPLYVARLLVAAFKLLPHAWESTGPRCGTHVWHPPAPYAWGSTVGIDMPTSAITAQPHTRGDPPHTHHSTTGCNATAPYAWGSTHCKHWAYGNLRCHLAHTGIHPSDLQPPTTAALPPHTYGDLLATSKPRRRIIKQHRTQDIDPAHTGIHRIRAAVQRIASRRPAYSGIYHGQYSTASELQFRRFRSVSAESTVADAPQQTMRQLIQCPRTATGMIHECPIWRETYGSHLVHTEIHPVRGWCRL